MLTEDTARSIGMSSYFPHVRRVFVDILRALDVHYGRPLMMTSTQNVNKVSSISHEDKYLIIMIVNLIHFSAFLIILRRRRMLVNYVTNSRGVTLNFSFPGTR
jgi:hypothetical protein